MAWVPPGFFGPASLGGVVYFCKERNEYIYFELLPGRIGKKFQALAAARPGRQETRELGALIEETLATVQ